MKKYAPLLLLCLVCTAAASAQNTQITASHIAAFGGAPITGTFCLSPVNQAGQPINVVTPTGQQFSPKCRFASRSSTACCLHMPSFPIRR